jgi:S-(hydroxymethyl)glutathione dehydrogenase/alcohol dehydrogenase
MKTLAAILVETGRPLELADLELPVLKSGQVLVKIGYSGVCHTQLLEAAGHRGVDNYLPHCLGHEASGEVLEIGPDVNKCNQGDRVILTWMRGSGADVPGTVYRWKGRSVNAGGVTTFQEHAVVSENRLVSLPDQVGGAEGALMGCAVPTGFGAVWNSAAAQTGMSIAVFGVGGIGCAAVGAAAALDADPLIAVDVKDARLRLAETFGASNLINAMRDDPLERARELCPSGLDLAIEATGRPEVMQQALAAVRPRGGTVVIIGNAKHGERLQLDPMEFNQGKRLIGTWGGDNDPDRDFVRYCQLLIDGQLDLKPLIPKTYRLREINQALEDLEQGTVPRPIVRMRNAECGMGSGK